MPVRTLKAARKTGLSLPVACSVLMQESGGGRNEFGHDPTVAQGWGTVTQTKYAAYTALRDNPTAGARCQGVGPVQLTAYVFQAKADKMGGCWRPYINMLVGFEALAENIRRDGLLMALTAYNGSGPAADAYGQRAVARANDYAGRLGL